MGQVKIKYVIKSKFLNMPSINLICFQEYSKMIVALSFWGTLESKIGNGMFSYMIHMQGSGGGHFLLLIGDGQLLLGNLL